jgi:AcrR family transcriptional regulator
MSHDRPFQDSSSRPLRADARRNREAVLRAAADRFERDGLTVSLDAIAAHAGVGPGTLHRHFATKHALLAALVIDRVGELTVRLGALAEAEDPDAALRDAVRAMLAEGARSEPLKAALAATEFDIRAARPDAAKKLRRALAVLLSRAQAKGSIRADVDADDLMALVAGTFKALEYRDSPAAAQRIEDILFDGLVATGHGSIGAQWARRVARSSRLISRTASSSSRVSASASSSSNSRACAASSCRRSSSDGA